MIEAAVRGPHIRKYWDAAGGRLVYFGEPATEEFWDRHWSRFGPRDYGPTIPRRSLVVRETSRYLAPGSLVLEGGCGPAVNSWYLHRLGYRTLAIDYAPMTVIRVARRAPEVRPSLGDVRQLALPTGALDGYWSLGVIEHFYDGYDAVLDEMHRVLRSDGMLFLTFPCMSRLRRLKRRLGAYPPWPASGHDLDRFYQFALAGETVVGDLRQLGFRPIRRVPFLGVTGLCEELGSPGRLLDAWLSGGSRTRRWARAAADAAVRRFSNHCLLLVMRKS